MALTKSVMNGWTLAVMAARDATSCWADLSADCHGLRRRLEIHRIRRSFELWPRLRQFEATNVGADLNLSRWHAGSP